MEKVLQTRALLQQSVELAEPFVELLRISADSLTLDATRAFLAIHLRLTDKVIAESPENASLNTQATVTKIKRIMTDLHCDSVFLCSDDRYKQQEINDALKP